MCIRDSFAAACLRGCHGGHLVLLHVVHGLRDPRRDRHGRPSRLLLTAATATAPPRAELDLAEE
eukprot:7019491-Alexandrium_andersonii.AAC.1